MMILNFMVRRLLVTIGVCFFVFVAIFKIVNVGYIKAGDYHHAKSGQWNRAPLANYLTEALDSQNITHATVSDSIHSEKVRNIDIVSVLHKNATRKNRNTGNELKIPHETKTEKATGYYGETVVKDEESKTTSDVQSLIRHRPDVRPDILVFNRVHKTGSENFVTLIQSLERKNKFKHIRCDTCYPDQKRLTTHLQKSSWVKYFDNLPKRKPISYDRHVYFTDFEEFGRTNPIWFSMVREPLAKFESKFYYSRKLPSGLMYEKIAKKGHEWITNTTKEAWREKDLSECVLQSDPECDLTQGVIHDDLYIDLTIPYFCGHDTRCSLLGSKWAYKKAVENVEKWYPVVGILEDLDATTRVLEAKIPRYFSGFSSYYRKGLKNFQVNKGRDYEPMTPEARSAVAGNLTLEIEFYDYLKDRLQKQLEDITEKKSNSRKYV